MRRRPALRARTDGPLPMALWAAALSVPPRTRRPSAVGRARAGVSRRDPLRRATAGAGRRAGRTLTAVARSCVRTGSRTGRTARLSTRTAWASGTGRTRRPTIWRLARTAPGAGSGPPGPSGSGRPGPGGRARCYADAQAAGPPTRAARRPAGDPGRWSRASWPPGRGGPPSPGRSPSRGRPPCAGRSAGRPCDRSGRGRRGSAIGHPLGAPPALAVARILDEDPGRGQLVAEPVGRRPVTRLPGARPGIEEGLEHGLERLGRAIKSDPEHAVELVEDSRCPARRRRSTSPAHRSGG